MSAKFLGWTLRNALLSSLVLGCSAVAVQASAATSPPAPASVDQADRAADRSAAGDLRDAMTALGRRDWRSARDFLERAETALLNREVLDLGPALRIDHPLPATTPIERIKHAEATLHGADRAKAADAIKEATSALDTDAAQHQQS